MVITLAHAHNDQLTKLHGGYYTSFLCDELTTTDAIVFKQKTVYTVVDF